MTSPNATSASVTRISSLESSSPRFIAATFAAGVSDTFRRRQPRISGDAQGPAGRPGAHRGGRSRGRRTGTGEDGLLGYGHLGTPDHGAAGRPHPDYLAAPRPGGST